MEEAIIEAKKFIQLAIMYDLSIEMVMDPLIILLTNSIRMPVR